MDVWKIFFILNALNICDGQNYDKRSTVTVAQGTIVGVKVYPVSSRVVVNAYLGIPYAEIPEGRLRFAVPERHRGWNGTFNAANYGPVCPFRATSLDINEKEDCLYLNIWTPQDAYGQKFPVIVYMESEQVTGLSSLIRVPGQDLAAEGAIVVSVSFRQNIFGFFCLGTPEARGNLGLLDQYLALVWVKENIAQFCGNPQLVTLMGHSSSAVTVLHHLTSPRTSGLFTRAIIMSGSSIAPWYSKDPISISNKLASDLGCAMSSAQATLDCLRTKSVQEILRQFDRQSEVNSWDKSVMPVIDTFLQEKDRYLPYTLNTVLQAGNYTAVPLLTGITDFFSNAEHWKWSDLNHDYSQLLQYAEEFVIPSIVERYGYVGPNKNAIKDIIRWKYLWSAEGDATALAERIHNLQWEARVAAPHDRQIALFAKNSAPIYTYCLHQYSTLANVSTTSAIGGDLLLLFGPVLLQQVARRRFNVAEASLSQQLKQLWIAFAKQGNPTPNGYRNVWQPYSQTNKYIQYFGDWDWDAVYYENSINFWNKLLPTLAAGTSTVNTIPKELQSSPDPAAGFRHAMYTLVGLVVALLALLLVCVVLLKKRAKERNRHMGF